MGLALEEPLEIKANSELIPVGSKDLYIGRLSARKLLRLTKVADKALKEADASDLQQIVAALKDKNAKKKGKKAQVDIVESASLGERINMAWSTISAILTEQTVGEVLGAISGEDPDWCLDNFDAFSIERTIRAVLKHNEVDLLKQVFTRASNSSQASSPQTSLVQRAS